MLSNLLNASHTQRPVIDALDAAIDEGRKLRESGHPAEAIHAYERATAIARERNDRRSEARCLVLIAVSQGALFQYRRSLASAEEAARLAEQIGDNLLAGTASINISTIYTQLGDFPSAERAASRAVDLLRQAPTDTRSRSFLTKALLSRAFLCLLQGKTAEGKSYSDQAIGIAVQSGDAKLQATAWEALGTAQLREDDVIGAAKAFQKTFSLQKQLHDDDGLAVTKEHLAELEIKKPNPDYTAALRLIDEAFASPSHTFKANAQYYPIHIRAKILLKSGRKTEALAEFQRAVESAEQWRQGALPGDTTNTQTVASLDAVYKDYAQLAAGLSLEKRDPKLAQEALAVLSKNRAASLREQLTLAYERDSRLPDSYFQKVHELEAAQARVTLGRNSKEDKAELTRIRLELSDLENQIGLKPDIILRQNEKKNSKNSLRDIQSRLGAGQTLLSFCLGKDRSFVWAITGDQVNLFELSGEDEIQMKAAQFSAAVREGRDARYAGEQLSRALLSQLPETVWEKPEWLLVPDGALLNAIPFAALPDLSLKHRNATLIAARSLRLLPSELLLLEPKDKTPLQRFVGIGDPVYNLADARLARSGNTMDLKPVASSVSLARLIGSEKEIHAAAKVSGASDSQLLLGAEANTEDLQKSLAGRPEIVHFAVHVVSPPGQPEQAALALSLKNGIPELLTPEAIATFRVPGSLVVMSGCSSEQGKTIPSAGLMGLSRSWLLAGAAAVIVSSWPTPDDSGRFFSSFYSQLEAPKSGSLARRAAIALQRAQLEMQQNSGYRRAPTFWAAYSIISKE